MPRARNKAFVAMHQLIIEKAVELIAVGGVDGLSLTALARALKINRATLYYHFADREALITAVKTWSSEQLALGFSAKMSRVERADHISRFVLENPDLIKLWIDDFLTPGDIRARYPLWDALVAGMAENLAHHSPPIDPEIYCAMMLTSAFIAPRIYRNSIRPDLDIDTIIERFTQEQTRVLAVNARLPEEPTK